MPRIVYEFASRIADGPSVVAGHHVDADAYYVMDVPIAAAAAAGTPREVEVRLGADAGAMQMLLVTAKDYRQLQYTVNRAAAAAPAPTLYTLDGPLLLIGAGAVALLDPAPTALFLYNADTATENVVRLFIARDPTP